ncbi:phage-related protein [Hymenobacter sp. 9A]|uniref:Phage-related protein n=2 Tax=Hymenobacter caeli TaxID=2735894 RepID=A0ABX2FMH4_9BACT|nr:phage-related protein [Hymenobacter caeli]
MVRQIEFFGSHFQEFYLKQPVNVRTKIQYVFNLVRTEPRVPEKFFKHLTGTDGLYEIRVEVSNSIYRIFCFFDAGSLVVVANAFQKKTPQTPRTELERALRLKAEYFQQKSRSHP